MTTTDSVFQRAVVNMLAEIFDGPPGHEAYLLKGDLFRQPDLALTLRRLQTNGPDEFYSGRTAREIVRAMNRNAGLINADDMHGYAANSDSGTGRPRGFTVFGPPEAAGPLREIATQFPDFGMVGATTTKSRRRGGSEQSVFNLHGLPGIWTTIDPIE